MIVLSIKSIAQSNQEIDSLKKELQTIKIDSNKVKTLNNIAYAYCFFDPSKSIIYTKQSIALATKNGLKKHVLDAYYIQTISFDIQRNLAETKKNALKLIALSKQNNNTLFTGKGYFLLGNVYEKESNEYEALKLFETSLYYFKKSNSDIDIANIYSRMASVNSKISNYNTAITFYIKSLNKFQELNDESGIKMAYYNIGNTYMSLEEYDKAKHYYLKSLELGKKFDNKIWISDDYASLGKLYIQTDSLAIAYNYLSKALKICETSKLNDGIAFTYSNFGLLFMKKGNYEKAKKCFQKSIDIFRKINDNYALSENLKNLGAVSLKLNQLNEAKTNLDEALELIKNENYKKLKLEIYFKLSEYYKLKSDYRAALSFTEKHNALKDSVFNETKSNQIAGIQIQYETKQKEKENQFLKQNIDIQKLTIEKQNQSKRIILIILVSLLILACILFWMFESKKKANQKLQQKKELIDSKNSILETTQQKLQQSLNEKEVLLKEIHHRVKNNLQLVNSLLSIQARTADDGQQVKDFLYKSQNRVQSMALIHETLYLSDNLSKVDFEKYVLKLTEHLFSSFDIDKENINASINTNAIILDVETVIPLGLILTELINNILKHAFPKGKGTIVITLQHYDNENFDLIVFDNGIGLPENYNEKEATLGMQLINDLIRQIDGELLVDKSNGTQFLIRFPKKIQE